MAAAMTMTTIQTARAEIAPRRGQAAHARGGSPPALAKPGKIGDNPAA
jgi:hypothetical protein